MDGELVARDFMTTPVHTVRPTEPLRKVVALICLHRISGVPVVDGRRNLLGLVSERDLLEALYPDRPQLRQGRRRRPRPQSLRDIGDLPAQEIMVRNLVTAGPDADPLHLASLMALHRVRRIPIVVGRKLVGIVSLGDVYRAIFEMRRGPLRADEGTEARGGAEGQQGAAPSPEAGRGRRNLKGDVS